ncbi:hypothetical protein Ndes2526A_g02340 [Nannochloris sp. 'desiccata']
MHPTCLDQLNFQTRSHGSSLPRRKGRLCICSALPPATCSEAVSEARAALRRYREASRENDSNVESDASAVTATATTTTENQLLATTKNRLTVQLPVPSPNYKNDDLFRCFDEGEWPGGIQQRFRALRPCVENFIDSFGSPSFVGMLESPADGIGVWTALNGTATVVTFVNNATFAPFIRLCQGDFGDKVLNSEHVLIAINPNWTQSKDIGQLWDRKLKKKAAELIDDPNSWLPLYHLEDVRTAAGSLGVLWRSYPGPWRLYSAVVGSELLVEIGGEERGNVASRIGNILSGKNSRSDEDSALVAVELLLESEIRPGRSEMIQLLNAANTQRKQDEKSKKKTGKKLGQGWWGGL